MSRFFNKKKKLTKDIRLHLFTEPQKLGERQGKTMFDMQQTQPSWQTPEPKQPKKLSPVLKWVMWLVGLGTVLVIALVAMAAAATSTRSSQLNTSNTPAPTHSAPAPVHKQTLPEWLAGPGGKALYKVKDDLTTISQDAQDYDMTQIKLDGEQLANDAGLARALAPPQPIRHEYKLAMRDFVRAGNLLEQGDLIEGTTEMANGTQHIATATADLTQ